MILSLDDPSHWPTELSDAVRDLATSATGSEDEELTIDPHMELCVSTLLRSHKLLAYHCTRLLPHEEDAIRTGGLLPLSREMITNRIDDARARGAISVQQRDTLLSGHMLADDHESEDDYRKEQTCFAPTYRAFDEQPGAFHRPLSLWGGEAVYAAQGVSEMRDQLGKFGEPSIVVAALAIKQPLPMRTFRSLPALFAGLPDSGCTIFYKAPVPGKDIQDVWHPGDLEYDRFRDLVRR